MANLGKRMRFEESLDQAASQILLKGLGRPWKIYAAHLAIFAANYGGFIATFRHELLKLFRQYWRPGATGTGDNDGKDREQERRSLAALLYAKFLVWQHLAEAIGCRQGPLGGYFGLPNNWKFRLSLRTIKYPLFSFLGKKRNIVDFLVHSLFFVVGVAFLKAKEYKLKYIRTLCACDVWIFLSDMSQFYASTGHAYFSMLLSACFPENGGRLAGMQAALLMQWFFSGVGKAGPWFTYVNAPFMLQSKIFAGQQWLFNLLVKSPTDLSPTLFGKVFAHVAASVEYLAPIALMMPKKTPLSLEDRAENSAPIAQGAALAEPSPAKTNSEMSLDRKRNRLASSVIWGGLTGIVAMHTYILSMPAPFDVYSWNMSFGLSAIYLFFYANFGFDHKGAQSMNPGLAAFLMSEFVLCWYGQFFPDRVGYYLSHRYWAGNWVQTLFFFKNDKAVWEKLGRVKTCSDSPRVWESLQSLSRSTYISNMAYLWLGNLNMKPVVGLLKEAVRLVGGSGADLADYLPIGLTQFCCGEFRDALYALPILPTIQEQIGFDAGECFMVRIGAFGLLQDTATWGIYDLKAGLVKSGLLSISALSNVHSYPSQAISTATFS